MMRRMTSWCRPRNETCRCLDVRATVPVLVAFLDRRGRESALLKLYELLDEQLASPELVNAYVHELQDASAGRVGQVAAGSHI